MNPRRRFRLGACGLMFASWFVGARARAEVSIHVQLEDTAADAGAEVATVLEASAAAWEACLRPLSSSLQVTVPARFVALPCEAGKWVAARAHTRAEQTRDGILFPSPLAAYITGASFAADGLGIELNGGLLPPNACDGQQWSTELPNGGTSKDDYAPALFAAVQHELGHILGLDIGYDVFTPAAGGVSVYMTRLFSAKHGLSLVELDQTQLEDAVTTPYNVVWTGEKTRTLAATQLTVGVPELFVSRPTSDPEGTRELLGSGARLLSRGNGDSDLTIRTLRYVDDACGAEDDLSGQIVVVSRPSCGIVAAVTNVVRDGAAAAVVEADDGELPAELSSPIPVVLLGAGGPTKLSGETGTDVVFRINNGRLQGADASGNVYLHTPLAYDPAVSLVHLSPVTVSAARDTFPTSNVPELGFGLDATCGFALSLLLDMGYAKPGCGDGALAPDEECDDGLRNSDTRPNACRFSCQVPHCGDGVVDEGEACDHGILNGATPDACRPGCTEPYCGDGVVDFARGERCDDGAANGNDGPVACGPTCLPSSCGDGIVNDGEVCDEGANNSNVEADRCRTDCSAPRCGDGVVDLEYGETCDDGNSLDDPWCDSDCRAPGDGGARVAADGGASETALDAGHVPTSPSDAAVDNGVLPSDAAAAAPPPPLDERGCQCVTTATAGTPSAAGVVSLTALLGLVCRRCLRRRPLVHRHRRSPLADRD